MHDKGPRLILARIFFYAQCLCAMILVYAVRANSFRLDKENWPDVIPEWITLAAAFSGQLISFAAPIVLVYQNSHGKNDLLLTFMTIASVILSGVIWAVVIALFA